MLVASIISLFILGGGAGPTDGAAEPSFGNPSIDLVQLKTAQGPASKFDAHRCRALADLASASRPVFMQNASGEWECSYLLEYSETGHSPSVFIQIKGMKPGIWKSFRLKLNFGSILSRQVLGTRAANLVHALLGTGQQIADLDAALATGRDFETSIDGVTLKFRQERIDKNRFNLFGSRNMGQAGTTVSEQE